jgi:hypothetical protein
MIMNVFIKKKCHSESSHNDIKEHMTLNKIFGSGPPSPFIIVVRGQLKKVDV